MPNEQTKKDATLGHVCKRNAINCYATAIDFQIKVKTYGRWKIIKSIAELLMPLLVFGAIGQIQYIGTSLLLWIAFGIGMVQIVLNAFSYIYKWEEVYYYSIEAMRDNFAIADEFERLWISCFEPTTKTEYDKLMIRYNYRSEQDYKFYISDRDKIKGRRAAYAKYNLPCPTCEKNPRNIDNKYCPNCGIRSKK